MWGVFVVFYLQTLKTLDVIVDKVQEFQSLFTFVCQYCNSIAME